MNSIASGRKGGIATRDNHPSVCPLCGSLIKSQFYSEIGQKGGQKGGESTLERYGPEHYRNIGRMGGRGNKRKSGCSAKHP